MPRKPILMMSICLLGACDLPTREFAGIPAQTIVVEQSTFDVRINGERAGVIRTNATGARGLVGVAGRAAVAMEMASGCDVVPGSVTGDRIVYTADLDC